MAKNITDVIGDAINASNGQPRTFEQDGFTVPPIPSSTGDGLPSSRVKPQRTHVVRRNMVHWFVPEVGVINMYINPQRINYKYSKLINTERTKGGFISQMWGENLTIISLSGHTGSSGIEGINVLREIYRSEQLNFDPIGLTIASDSMVSGLGDLINGAGQGLGAVGSLAGSVTSGIMGLNPLTQSILPKNPPTLASLAFSVEMYYSGKAYRGFFTAFSFDESADKIGLYDYNIEFTVTQERGYRVNSMPWHHAANMGASQNSEGGIPFSYGKGRSFGR